jgi:SEL1 protein
LRVGDIYYYEKKDPVHSLQFYQSAELDNSAQAFFNIAYMYHYGIGQKRDFHLAKRYYDRALAHEPNSFLAVKSSLFILYLNEVFGCTSFNVSFGIIRNIATALLVVYFSIRYFN